MNPHIGSKFRDWLTDEGIQKEVDTAIYADLLGQSDNPGALDELLELLRHPSEIVREGAVFGLSRHTETYRVEVALQNAAAHDPSDDVRSAAADALGD